MPFCVLSKGRPTVVCVDLPDAHARHPARARHRDVGAEAHHPPNDKLLVYKLLVSRPPGGLSRLVPAWPSHPAPADAVAACVSRGGRGGGSGIHGGLLCVHCVNSTRDRPSLMAVTGLDNSGSFFPRSFPQEAFFSQPVTDPYKNDDDCRGIGFWLTEKRLGSEFEIELNLRTF